MTSRIQTNRFIATGGRPPSTRPVGELAINFADNQLSVVDPTPAARDLFAIRWHSATAQYAAADMVRQAGGLYQAKASTPPRAFNIADWDQFLTTAQGDTRWLRLSGGTLTGLLTLSGAPTSNLHAATKLYVDTGDGTRLPLAGGTLTGPLTLSGDPTQPLHASTKQYTDTKLALAGGTMTGALTLSGSPVNNLHAATKTYVDTADATKLPLAGGTLTGLLTLSGPPTVALHAATKAYVDSVAGNYLPLTGGTVTGQITAPVFKVSTSLGFIDADASYCYYVQDAYNWQWRYTRADGSMAYVRGNDGVALFAIDPSGNGKFAGGILNVYDAYCGIAADASARHFIFANTWSFDWDVPTGDLAWSGGGAARFRWRASDNLSYNPLAPVGGVGAYQNLSDARTKQNVQDLNYGMAQVRALRPRQFERVGSSTTEIGFIAQEVQPIVPEATPVMGVPLPDGSGGLNDPNPTLSVTGDALLAVAIAALQSLDQRVTLLENPSP